MDRRLHRAFDPETIKDKAALAFTVLLTSALWWAYLVST